MLNISDDLIFLFSFPVFPVFFLAWMVLVVSIGSLIKHFILIRPVSATTALPLNPDPYEIAYLQSPNKLIQLAILSLLHQNLIQLSKSRRSVRRTQKGPPSNLHLIERIVYETIQTNPSALKILKDPKLFAIIEKTLKGTTWKLENQGLLQNKPLRFKILRGIVNLLVWGMAVVKFDIAFAPNDGSFLVFAFLLLTYYVAPILIKTPRISAKGKKMLKDFKLAYGQPHHIDLAKPKSVLLGLSVANADILPSELKERMDVDFETGTFRSPNSTWFTWH